MCKPNPRWQVVRCLALSILISGTSISESVVATGAEPAQAVAQAPAPEVGPYSAAALQVYRASCLLCHDVDGRGELGRDASPTIPDFTDGRWQSLRSDALLSRSILEGKGKGMPRMKNKLGSVDVKLMVVLVRAFRDGKLVVEEEPDPASRAEKSTAPPNSGGPPQGQASRMQAEKAQGAQDGSRLFQKSCAMCHGRDGKGTLARESLSSIPDFAVRDWQQKRSNAQLLVSILDGKGAGMPAFRNKIQRERAREIVTYIRTFAPAATREIADSSNEFEARFNKLVQEFDDIARQIRALSAGTPTPTPPADVPKK
jgi:mono/diheme cytochrome c family protein